MDLKEAQELVQEELDNAKDGYDPVNCQVLESETIIKDWGWVFFYQSKDFLKSGDFRDMLAGNAPIIVNRNTGALTHTGTAYDIEQYIKEYEASLV
jgi:hypothetical protein